MNPHEADVFIAVVIVAVVGGCLALVGFGVALAIAMGSH